jgi:HD superfamily phosphodiesterase
MSDLETPAGYDRLAKLAETAKDMYDRGGLKRHNWDHISRNFNRAVIILEQECADIELTLAGVILHDIGYFYGNLKDHAHLGAEQCARLLVDLGYCDEEVEAIRHCIVAHDPASGVVPETVEAKIVYDADMLDKSDIALLLSGSLADVAEEFGVTVTVHAVSFINRFEPLLQEGRAFFTEAGRSWDNGNLAAIIDLIKRLREQTKLKAVA